MKSLAFLGALEVSGLLAMLFVVSMSETAGYVIGALLVLVAVLMIARMFFKTK